MKMAIISNDKASPPTQWADRLSPRLLGQAQHRVRMYRRADEDIPAAHRKISNDWHFRLSIKFHYAYTKILHAAAMRQRVFFANYILIFA